MSWCFIQRLCYMSMSCFPQWGLAFPRVSATPSHTVACWLVCPLVNWWIFNFWRHSFWGGSHISGWSCQGLGNEKLIKVRQEEEFIDESPSSYSNMHKHWIKCKLIRTSLFVCSLKKNPIWGGPSQLNRFCQDHLGSHWWLTSLSMHHHSPMKSYNYATKKA